MFSTSSKYAIKAVLYLALHSNENNRLMVKDIYKPVNVPRAYLAKLLQDLSKHNVVSSARGPKGGFYLNDENKANSVMDIVSIIDGRKKLESCMLSLKNCDKDKPCPLHQVIYKSRAKMVKSLESINIEELAEDLKHKKVILPL